MNIIQLAKEHGVVTELGYGDAIFDQTISLQKFAAAVIEDYKANLMPMAWLDEDSIVSFGHMKYGFIDRRDRAIPDKWTPLYALGETK